MPQKFAGIKKTPYLCSAFLKKHRDLAQLVAHTSGGREVAGSSPVIPTEAKELKTKGFQLLFLYALKFTQYLWSDGNRYGIRH